MIYLSRMMLRPKELEKIRKKISVENDELDCLTAMCYMGTGKNWKKTQRAVTHLRLFL